MVELSVSSLQNSVAGLYKELADQHDQVAGLRAEIERASRQAVNQAVAQIPQQIAACRQQLHAELSEQLNRDKQDLQSDLEALRASISSQMSSQRRDLSAHLADLRTGWQASSRGVEVHTEETAIRQEQQFQLLSLNQQLDVLRTEQRGELATLRAEQQREAAVQLEECTQLRKELWAMRELMPQAKGLQRTLERQTEFQDELQREMASQQQLVKQQSQQVAKLESQLQVTVNALETSQKGSINAVCEAEEVSRPDIADQEYPKVVELISTLTKTSEEQHMQHCTQIELHQASVRGLIATLEERCNDNFAKLESGSREHRKRIDELGLHNDKHQQQTERLAERIFSIEAAHEKANDFMNGFTTLRDELGMRHQQHQQHQQNVKLLSEQIFSIAAEQDNASSTLKNLAAMCEERDHQHRRSLDELSTHHDKHRQQTNHLSETMANKIVDARSTMEALTESCAKRLEQLEKSSLEHRDELDKHHMFHEEHQQRVKSWKEHVLAANAAHEQATNKIQSLADIFELQVSELVNSSKTNTELLSEHSTHHEQHQQHAKAMSDDILSLQKLQDQVTAMFEGRLSQLEDGNQEHHKKLEDLGVHHEKHQQNAQSLHEQMLSMDARQNSVNGMMETLTEMCECRLSQLEAAHQENHAKLDELALHHANHQLQAQSASKQMVAMEAAREEANRTIENLTEACERRFSQLSHGNQEHRDKLQEVGTHHEHHQLQVKTLSQKVLSIDESHRTTSSRIEDLTEMCEQRLSQLESGASSLHQAAQNKFGDTVDALIEMCERRLSRLENYSHEHGEKLGEQHDKLDKFGLNLESYRQEASVWSQQMLSIETVQNEANEILAAKCDRRLIELEAHSWEHGKRLGELDVHHAEHQQHVRTLFEQVPVMKETHEKASGMIDNLTTACEQRFSKLEKDIHEHRGKYEKLSKQHDKHQEHADTASEQMLSIVTTQTNTSSTVKALAEMCGRRLSELESGSQRHRDKLSKVLGVVENHQKEMVAIKAARDLSSGTIEKVQSREQRISEFEHRDSHNTLGIHLEEHKQHVRALSEQVQSVESMCSNVKQTVEVLATACDDDRLGQLESGLMRLGVNHEQRLLQLERVIQGHGDKLNEHGKHHEEHHQHVQRVSDHMLSSAAVQDDSSSRLQDLREMCERRLSQLETVSQKQKEKLEEVDEHHLAWKATLEQHLSQVENTNQEHRGKLEELGLQHEMNKERTAASSEHLLFRERAISPPVDNFSEDLQGRLSQLELDRKEQSDRLNELGKCYDEHQEYAKALSEQMRAVEAACAKTGMNITDLEGSYEERLGLLESGIQENWKKLDELGKHRDEHHEHVQTVSDHMLSSAQTHDHTSSRIQDLTEMCERRLSLLESSSNEHKDEMDDLRKDDELRQQQLQRVADYAVSKVETLTETCEQRLSQLERVTQEQRDKLFELGVLQDTAKTTFEGRLSQVENGNQENRDTLHELVIHHEMHREQAKAFSEQVSSVERVGSAHEDTKSVISTLTEEMNRRLMELENSNQTCQGGLDELSVRLEDHQQRSSAMSERMLSTEAACVKANAMIEGLAESFGQVSELEHGTREYRDKLDELSKHHEKYQQMVSDHMLSTSAAEEQTSSKIEILEEMCERRLSQLESGTQEHRDKLEELGNHHEQQQEHAQSVSDHMLHMHMLSSAAAEEKANSSIEALTEMCERRLCLLESGTQEHAEKLEELSKYHGKHQQDMQQVSDHIVSSCAAQEKTSSDIKAVKEMCEQRLSQLENGSQEQRDKLDEIGSNHERLKSTCEQHITQVENKDQEHRGKLEELGVQHEMHKQQTKDLSEQMSTIQTAHGTTDSSVEALTDMCERRLSRLESSTEEHGDNLKEVSAHHEELKASLEQCVSQAENNDKEHRGKLEEFGSQHEVHRQQTTDLSEKMAILQAADQSAAPAIENLKEMFERRLSQLESGSLEHKEKLEEVGVYGGQLHASFEKRLSQVENSGQEHRGKLEELDAQHEMHRQQTKDLSQQMLSAQGTFMEGLTEMYEQRLSQLESGSQEHREKLEEVRAQHVALKTTFEPRLLQVEDTSQEHKGKLDELCSQHEMHKEEAAASSQRLRSVESAHEVARVKLDELGSQHEAHKEQALALSQQMLSVESAHETTSSAAEALSQEWERRFSQLEQEHADRLAVIDKNHDEHQQHAAALKEQILKASKTMEDLEASCGERLGQLESGIQEHRGKLDELGKHHEQQQQHAQSVSDHMLHMHMLSAAATEEKTNSSIEAVTEMCERRLLQLENGSQEHKDKLNATSQDHAALKTKFEQHLSKVEDVNQEHVGKLEELSAQHDTHKQQTKYLSEVMQAVQAAHGTTHSSIVSLTEMCEQRLSQLESGSQERSAHHDQLKAAFEQHLAQVESNRQDHQGKLENFSAQHELHKQQTKDLAEQLSQLENGSQEHSAHHEQLRATFEQHLSRVDTDNQEHRCKLEELSAQHEISKQQTEALTEKMLAVQTEHGSAGPAIESLAEMCERRLSQLETCSREHEDKLDEKGAHHEQLKASFEQHLSQVENNHQQHRDKLQELGSQHEMQKQHTKAVSEEMQAAQGSFMEGLTEMYERRLSQLESGGQMRQDKLDALELRFSQVEDTNQEHRGKIDELGLQHDMHREQAASLSKQVLSAEKAHETTGPAFEMLSQMCERRLSQLELSCQKHGDRLDEFGVRHEEHQQHAKVLSEEVRVACEKASKTAEDLAGSYEQRLDQLESGTQEHRGKLEELSTSHEQHQQDAKALSEDLLIMKTANDRASAASQTLTETITELENAYQKCQDRLAEFAAANEEAKQRINVLSDHFVTTEEDSAKIKCMIEDLTKSSEQRLSKLEFGIKEHGDKLEEHGKQHHELHQQHAQSVSDHMLSSAAIDKKCNSKVEALTEMCEQRLSQLERGSQEQRDKLFELGVLQDTAKATFEGRLSQVENGNQENRNTLHELVIHHEMHREQAKAFSEQVSSVERVGSAHEETKSSISKLTEEMNQRLMELENSNQTCQGGLDELSVRLEDHQQRSSAMSERMLSTEAACVKANAMIAGMSESCGQISELAQSTQEHRDKLDELSKNYEKCQQMVSDQIRSSAAAEEKTSSRIAALTEKCEQRLAQLESGTQEHLDRLEELSKQHQKHQQDMQSVSDHILSSAAVEEKTSSEIKVVKEVCEGRLAQLENGSQEQRDKLEEVNSHHEQLKSTFEQHITKAETNDQEHRGKLQELGAQHEMHEQQTKDLSEQMLAVQTYHRTADSSIESLTEMCERRLSQLESGSQEQSVHHDQLKEAFEQHLSQVETSDQDHRGKLEELGIQHELHKQSTRAFSEEMQATQSSFMEGLTEMYERRLSQLENGGQQQLDKLGEATKHNDNLKATLERRISEVENRNQEHQGQIEKLSVEHDLHKQQTEDLSEKMVGVQTTHETAGPNIDSLKEMCERRLSQLESGSQEQQDKLDEVCAHHKELKTIFEQHVSQIETGHREHRGKLEQLGTEHEMHKEQAEALITAHTKALSEQMLSLKIAQGTVSPLNDTLTDLFEKRISDLESVNHEERSQQENALSEIMQLFDKANAATQELTVKTTGRLTELENFSQKYQDKFGELNKQCEEDHQHVEALLQHLGKGGMDTSCDSQPGEGKKLRQHLQTSSSHYVLARGTTESKSGASNGFERRLSELESCSQEHLDKLNEISVGHEKHGQRVNMLEKILERRLSQVEKDIQEFARKREAMSVSEQMGETRGGSQEQLPVRHEEVETQSTAAESHGQPRRDNVDEAISCLEDLNQIHDERISQLEREHQGKLEESVVHDSEHQQDVQALSQQRNAAQSLSVPEQRLSKLEGGILFVVKSIKRHAEKIYGQYAELDELHKKAQQRFVQLESLLARGRLPPGPTDFEGGQSLREELFAALDSLRDEMRQRLACSQTISDYTPRSLDETSSQHEVSSIREGRVVKLRDCLSRLLSQASPRVTPRVDSALTSARRSFASPSEAQVPMHSSISSPRFTPPLCVSLCEDRQISGPNSEATDAASSVVEFTPRRESRTDAVDHTSPESMQASPNDWDSHFGVSEQQLQTLHQNMRQRYSKDGEEIPKWTPRKQVSFALRQGKSSDSSGGGLGVQGRGTHSDPCNVQSRLKTVLSEALTSGSLAEALGQVSAHAVVSRESSISAEASPRRGSAASSNEDDLRRHLNKRFSAESLVSHPSSEFGLSSRQLEQLSRSRGESPSKDVPASSTTFMQVAEETPVGLPGDQTFTATLGNEATQKKAGREELSLALSRRRREVEEKGMHFVKEREDGTADVTWKERRSGSPATVSVRHVWQVTAELKHRVDRLEQKENNLRHEVIEIVKMEHEESMLGLARAGTDPNVSRTSSRQASARGYRTPQLTSVWSHHHGPVQQPGSVNEEDEGPLSPTALQQSTEQVNQQLDVDSDPNSAEVEAPVARSGQVIL